MAVIETVIYSLLKNDATVGGLVSTRIYPNIIPQGAAMPAITYEQSSGNREHTADGADGLAESNFQITCWGSTYISAKSVAEAVRKLLDGYSGTVSDRKIQFIFLTDESDVPQVSPEIDVLRRFGKRMSFTLMYDEAL